ncbi:hypothetical protein SETIT_6G096600v2 [Setaria italica]|uniref:ATP-dependent DNA helicase n=1 Tax=Setaria italica TaxID=4555 RepID=A0A368RK65_SETIT|nr:hypothetical protein SETIT_6G096600v2 [Setaria italica]
MAQQLRRWQQRMRERNVECHVLDNQWVVPYNRYLLPTFNCHINVKACSSIKSVKYLFKYIYKGHDRASVAVREAGKKDDKGNIDEITQYREGLLELHLPDMHMVTFHKQDKIERVVKHPGADESMLTSYFAYNRVHEEARGILYHDFPEHFTWESNAQNKNFLPRKPGKLPYMDHGITTQRTDAEDVESHRGSEVDQRSRTHSRSHRRRAAPQKLVHVQQDRPRAAARRGSSACCRCNTSKHLRTVNGVLLPLFQEAMERRGLIEEDNTLYECLTENSLSQMPSSLCRLFTTILVFCELNDVFGLVEQMVLIDIKNMLRSMGKDIRTFPLPEIDDTYDDATSIPHEIFEEASNDQNLQDRDAYNDIMSKVDTEQDGLFFVDGPGGTGKTFLYKALLGTLHNQNKLAIATTTSGVAAYIMPSGRTTHSRFKIPLTLEDGGCCSFTKQRQAVEALDNSLCDIMGRSKLSFGRKTAVFGGDFKQSFLFVQKGSRAQIVDASLRRSDLLEFMRHLKLVRNMRAQSDSWFADYLLRIGGGTKEVNRDGDVRLPDDIYNINMKMIGMFQGGEIVYHSFDSTINELHNYYPSEFLNTLTLNGLPPHLLKLKIGCLVILLRLYNGHL